MKDFFLNIEEAFNVTIPDVDIEKVKPSTLSFNICETNQMKYKLPQPITVTFFDLPFSGIKL
jgi:hypothetical protein